MSEKPYCYQREAFLLAATRRVAISNSTFYYQRNDVSLIDFQENRKRSHIPPLRAEMPIYKGIGRGGTSKKVPPRFHPDPTLTFFRQPSREWRSSA